MKTFTKFMLVFVAGLAAFSASTLAFAQGSTPVAPGGHGPHGGSNGQVTMGTAGPLYDLLEAHLADALGISLEEFEARHDAGETFYAIALDLGFEADEIYDLMYTAHQAALAQAVEEGLISAEQAARMANMGMGAFQSQYQDPANGFGPGTGNCIQDGDCLQNGDCLQDGVPLGTGPHSPNGGRNR